MAIPSNRSPEDGEPEGESYGAVIVAAEGLTLPDAVEVLRGIRFTGWIAPPKDGWIVILGDPGDGVVAAGRRGVVEVGGALAQRSASVVVVTRVRRDRQLAVVVWDAGEERGRYCSDPSLEPNADREVADEPVGAEIAESLADLLGRRDAATELTDLLEEELDPDSVYESERLRAVLRLLALPTWIVASGALPRDIPTGPAAGELTRMRGGATGAAAVVRAPALRSIRRRQTAPPVIADPPRGGGAGFEDWMF